MNICKDIKVVGKDGRPVMIDVYYQQDNQEKPVVVFAHGFKGFKDWGHWHFVARAFAEAGFFFVKFNFSHNGTTPDYPQDFADLEAFGENDYGKESNDIDVVLDWVSNANNAYAKEMKLQQLCLIGHSRGGGMAIVKAAQDTRITQLITWASVADLGYSLQDEAVMTAWKKDGVRYILNGRTQQNMPMYYSFVEYFYHHKNKFDIKNKANEIQVPWLIIHGDNDPAVSIVAARKLADYQPHAKLHIIDGANHVFGGSHPFRDGVLPLHAQELVAVSINFLLGA